MKLIIESFNRFVEEIDPDTIDLSSFQVKDEMNPEIWDENEQLRPEIKEKLVKIAQDFFDELNLPGNVTLKDIAFTGSLANYNWSEFSDVDLHLLVDFAEIDENLELVKGFLDFKRMDWNKTHDIRVSESEVEIYVQNDSEPHHSTGVYSIMSDEWLVKPSKEKPSVNNKEVQEKAAAIMDEIDELGELYRDGEFSTAKTNAETLKLKIRTMRQCGLETGGEYSSENLAFKTLRRNGYLGKLNDYKIGAYDRMASYEE